MLTFLMNSSPQSITAQSLTSNAGYQQLAQQSTLNRIFSENHESLRD